MGLIPGLERSQGWEPTPMFLPGKQSHDRQIRQVAVHGVTESDVTEQLSMHTCVQHNAKIWVLQNQIWVHSPEHCKAKLLTLGQGEEKHKVYYRAPGKESRQLVLKRPEHPAGVQGKVFKDRVRRTLWGLWSACGHSSDWLVVKVNQESIASILVPVALESTRLWVSYS